MAPPSNTVSKLFKCGHCDMEGVERSNLCYDCQHADNLDTDDTEFYGRIDLWFFSFLKEARWSMRRANHKMTVCWKQDVSDMPMLKAFRRRLASKVTKVEPRIIQTHGVARFSGSDERHEWQIVISDKDDFNQVLRAAFKSELEKYDKKDAWDFCTSEGTARLLNNDLAIIAVPPLTFTLTSRNMIGDKCTKFKGFCDVALISTSGVKFAKPDWPNESKLTRYVGGQMLKLEAKMQEHNRVVRLWKSSPKWTKEQRAEKELSSPKFREVVTLSAEMLAASRAASSHGKRARGEASSSGLA